MVSRQPRPCLRQQKLLAAVQQHLTRLSALTSAAAEALVNGNENEAKKMDKQAEQELGAKERAMGALRRHRHEHGC
jgi:hypothetical protein